jgi:hypothetical protein
VALEKNIYTQGVSGGIVNILGGGLFVFLVLQPTVVVFSQPGSGL